MRPGIKTAQARLIAQSLKALNPELYENCVQVVQPLLLNFKHVHFVLNEFENEYGEVDMIQKPLFIACVYRLYNPSHLIGMFNKLQKGLRDVIADALGYVNPENVNAFGKTAPAYYKNVRTRKRINDFCDRVYNNLKDLGELSPEELSHGLDAQCYLDIKKYLPSEDFKTVNQYRSY